MKSARYELWILVALIFLGFYATLGSYPLFNLDEGAFSEATREMLASHNFLTTYLNGSLRFDKPILIYWLQALSASIFGLNEFAMRLPSALAATLWALAVYRFSKVHFDKEKAFLATLFMVGSLQISIIAKAAIADALLNLFITLSMFAFYSYYETRRKRDLYMSFAFIALGTLTKGPVAIMIPLAVSFLFLLKDLRFWLRSIFDPLGIAIFLLLAGPWYVAEYLDQKEKFIEGFLFKHNLSRFGAHAMEGHQGSIFYYLGVLLLGTLPFTTVMLNAIGKIKECFDTPLKRYLALWFLFVLIFFSFSKTKLPHYIIYGYTPLFVLMAVFFDRIRSKTLLLLPFWIFSFVFLILPFFKEWALSLMKKGRYEYDIVQALSFDTSYILFFSFALLAGFWALRLSRKNAMIFVSFLMLVGANFFVAKVYARAAEEPIKQAALFAKRHHLKVRMEGINTPSFSFYLHDIVDRSASVVLTKKVHLSSYPDAKILFRQGAIVLLRRSTRR